MTRWRDLRDAWLGHTSSALARDARVAGWGLVGSFGRGQADEWSDLDLLVVVHDEQVAEFADPAQNGGDRQPAEHRAVLHCLLDVDRRRRLDALRLTSRTLGVAGAPVEGLADSLAPAAELAPVVVHNDLHEAQVIVGPHGVTGIIDWQTASVGHPFVDLDVLQWGRGALARLDAGSQAHRRAMWEGARGDVRYGPGYGALLDLAWTLNDGWWAATHATAPVTGFPLARALRGRMVDHARRELADHA